MRQTLALLLLLPATAIAQETEPERKVIFEKVTELEFERELELTGELVKPRMSIVKVRTDGVFNPLIKLRTNFNLELLQSADEVR